MDTYAVVKIAGHQHLVTEGMTLNVERLSEKEGSSVELSPVLFVKDGGYSIGTPTVDLKIKALIVKHLQGEKVDVFKYKSKVRYRRHTGFRAQLTQIKIEAIGNKKASAPKEEPVKEKEVKPKAKKVSKTKVK